MDSFFHSANICWAPTLGEALFQVLKIPRSITPIKMIDLSTKIMKVLIGGGKLWETLSYFVAQRQLFSGLWVLFYYLNAKFFNEEELLWSWYLKAMIKKTSSFPNVRRADVILHYYCTICINQMCYYTVHLFLKNEAQSILCPSLLERNVPSPWHIVYAQ